MSLQDTVSVAIPVAAGTSPFFGAALGALAVAATSIITAPFKGVDSKIGPIIRPAQPIIALALPMLAAQIPFIGAQLAAVPPDQFLNAPVGTLVGIAALEGVKALFRKRGP